MEYYDLLRAGATRSGGSSGFTPTEAQLTAMNSGIDSEKVAQIETNKTNILLKANTSDVNTATASLQAQINNIITPVTQDAEVQNARVGATGTSYSTLKERLDSENTNLTRTVSDISSVVKTNELFDESEVETGGVYLAGTGAWYANATYWSSGLIPVAAGATIYVDTNYISNSGVIWCGIKEDGTTYAYQGGVVSSADNKHAQIQTSSGGNIRYVRLGFRTSTNPDSVSVRTTPTTVVYIEQSSVVGLTSDITRLDSQIEETTALMYQAVEKTIDDLHWTSGYIDISGNVQSHSNFAYSETISVKPGDQFTYSLWGVNNVTAPIAAYNDDDEFVRNASVYYDSNYPSGDQVQFSGTYIVPEGVATIIFSIQTSVPSHVNTLSINVLELKTDVLSGEVETMQSEISEIESELENIGIINQWKNKIWVCFGTSITDDWSTNAHIGNTDEPTGKYPSYLMQMAEFVDFPSPRPVNPNPNTSNNLGIAGGRISGHILYYIRYYLRDNPNGIAIANNVDLITIEGGVNDYAGSVPLGSVGDTIPYTNSLLPDGTNEGTFAGACYCAFTEAIQYAPKATVVFLTETTGKNVTGVNNYSWGRLNSLGLKQIDYINMARAVAEYVGIPVIECGRDSMINAANPNYLADWIHHSYLGGKQYASVIWEKLKNIPCKITSLE